jgi:lipopolysaccharide transport system permease protein
LRHREPLLESRGRLHLTPETELGTRTPTAALGAPLTVIRPTRGWVSVGLRDLLAYRELLFLLAWRDVKVRYKQTVIGAAWAIAQPLVAMLVLTLVFAHFVRVPTDGLPYPLLVFAGLLPWQLFSQALNRSSLSLVSNSALISKTYFPRVIIPVAAVGAPLVDFLVSSAVLAVLMACYGVAPAWGALTLPFFLALGLLAAAAAGLWLAALNAQYRDVGYIVPFLVQIGMYLSPVVYPVSAVPERWRTLYGLNPMTSVIDGFRWGLLHGPAPSALLVLAGVLGTGVVLTTGLIFFTRAQRTLADVI